MDLLPSISLLDLLQWVCVAVPFGIVVTASEKPRADRRALLVLAASAGACIVVGWPLAMLMGVDTMLGYAITLSVVASIAGYMMSHELRRNPELDSPATTATSAMVTFAAAGLSAFLIDDGAVRLIVLAGALFGTGLSVGYFLRVRRGLRAPS
ncbi:MAG: hypothetical protein IPP98_10485 [Gemmatimonadetes bacterium]|nr:hypothetical protein [Gemmatimonadota bacterium]